MMKLVFASAILLLAGCTDQQAADSQVKAQTFAAKVGNAVQVGCSLDGQFVPIGQDAAAVIAPAVGAANAGAGTLVMAAVTADKALVHPAVVAVCKSLLGAKAAPAVVAAPADPAPATAAVAKP